MTAAAFPLAFLTAWHMLSTHARSAEGDTVLVLAAGSGVGQAAVQFARTLGASLPRPAARGSSSAPVISAPTT